MAGRAVCGTGRLILAAGLGGVAEMASAARIYILTRAGSSYLVIVTVSG
jgi:hypothetical protein